MKSPKVWQFTSGGAFLQFRDQKNDGTRKLSRVASIVSRASVEFRKRFAGSTSKASAVDGSDGGDETQASGKPTVEASLEKDLASSASIFRNVADRKKGKWRRLGV